MLITEDYIAQNRQLHEAIPEYGTSGLKWARLVMDICAERGIPARERPMTTYDLVCADDAGVCFVPFEHAEAVLAEAVKIDAGDTLRKEEIARGVDVRTLVTKKYK